MITIDCSIFVTKKARKELSEKYGVVASTISEATHFQRNSALSREIRCNAVNSLGCILFASKKYFL